MGIVTCVRVIIIEDVDILRNDVDVDVPTTTVCCGRYMWPSRRVGVWTMRDIGMAREVMGYDGLAF